MEIPNLPPPPYVLKNRAIARGKWIFWFFATLFALGKIATLVVAFSHGLGDVKWVKSVLIPLSLLFGLWHCWKGDRFFRILLACVQILSGAVMSFVIARVMIKMANITPPEMSDFYLRVIGLPVGSILVFSLFDLLMGLTFLCSPSLRAYLNHRSEQEWIRQSIRAAE